MRGATSVVALTIFMAVLLTAATVRAAATPPPLHLHAIDLPPAAATIVQALGAPAGPLIVQFRGPISGAQRAALDATGVRRLAYLPDFAYLVAGTPRQLRAAAGVPGLARSLPLPAAARLAPALLTDITSGQAPAGPLRLLPWPGQGAALTAALAAAQIDPSAPLSLAELRALARMPALAWAEPAGRPRLLNARARAIMGVATAWQDHGLYGAGQRVAVSDSGLDTGVLATLSPDFAGRIVATDILSPTGDLEDENGHGTHVAGSVAGAGVQSGANPTAHSYSSSFAGMAPEAQLVIQAFETDSSGAIYGIPDDYYELFQAIYSAGARVHTNSWGDLTGPPSNSEAAFGGYPLGSQRTDQFIWDHPDLAVFFAAGNSGKDGVPGTFGICSGGNGVIDPDSLLAPGTAKNVITVGASESDRSSGGLGSNPWILLDLFCLSKDPIATDTLADNPDGMAAFSSRGPTDDGRSKPDLVAPGTNILSNASHASTPGFPHETNTHYAYNLGTSMATPLAAGTGVLAREWLVRQGSPNPSAALVKALLLNTTHDIAPGQYGSGTTQEIPAMRPNSVAGWGRADLRFLSAAAPFTLWYDDRGAGLSSGQQVDYTHSAQRPLQVQSSAEPLRVMLVWTDPPASLAASKQLVNDLDLEVVGPDGTVYHGNGGASADRINNVEGVIITSPTVGTYTLRVRGFNVPVDSQPYALVVAGPLAAAQAPQIDSQPQGASVLAGEAFRLSVAARGSPALRYQWYRAGQPVGGATASTYSVSSATLAHSGTYSVTVTNSAGSATSNAAEVTVTQRSQTISFAAPLGKRYGDAAFALSATSSSGLPISYQVLSGPASLSGATLSLLGAGEVALRATQAGNGIYAPAQAEVRLSVAKAALLAQADNKVRRPGEPNPPLTISYSGFVGADTAADLDTPPSTSTSATTQSGLGSYPISVEGGADANYSFSYVAGMLSITDKLVATLSWAAPQPIIYGTLLDERQLNAAAQINGAPVGGSYTYEPPPGSVLGAGANILRVTFTPNDSATYAPIELTTLLTVHPAALTVRADSKRIMAGDPLPPLTLRYSGFVNGEGPADLDTPAQLSTSATQASPPGSYPISVTGASDRNYAVSFVNATLTVQPRSSQWRVYLPLGRR